MATIYRFIVESGGGKSVASGGRSRTESSTKITGKSTTLLQMLGGGNKGGVEHNRKFRAINPLLNRATGGYWEKATRLGRAGLGLVKYDATTGKKIGISGPAIAIIIAMIVQIIMKHHNKLIQMEQEKNKLNFKSLENGVSSIRGSYDVAVNVWSGKISYNQNK